MGIEWDGLHLSVVLLQLIFDLLAFGQSTKLINHFLNIGPLHSHLAFSHYVCGSPKQSGEHSDTTAMFRRTKIALIIVIL